MALTYDGTETLVDTPLPPPNTGITSAVMNDVFGSTGMSDTTKGIIAIGIGVVLLSIAWYFTRKMR